jgi:hypothetical protein
MKIDGFPVRIIAWIKRATVGFELVREDQLKLCARRMVRVDRICVFRSVEINQAEIPAYLRDLGIARLDDCIVYKLDCEHAPGRSHLSHRH